MKSLKTFHEETRNLDIWESHFNADENILVRRVPGGLIVTEFSCRIPVFVSYNNFVQKDGYQEREG